MLGLISPLGFAVVALYVYVGFAAGRAEARSGASYLAAAAKAATWPVTIWHTIEKLYLTTPASRS